MDNRKIVILGAQGMVGSALMKLLGEQAIGYDRDTLDVTDFAALRGELEAHKHEIQAVINCVAFNNVDGAEDNPVAADLLNHQVPSVLAEITKDISIPLVHFSTGYVFDGSKQSFTENDTPHPLSEYAKSKLQGEQAVVQNTDAYYIVRTNVVFGPAGTSSASKQSFVDKILALSKERKAFNLVSDEVNSITYAPDLAQAVINLLGQPYGIYHITNSGTGSWYDMGKFILEHKSGYAITAIDSKTLERKAVRPKFAVLANTKVPPLRPWQQALQEYLKNQL